MFSNLLESRARSSRNVTGQAVSLVLHSAGIAMAVFVTQEVVTAAPPRTSEQVDFVAPPPPPQPSIVPPRDAPAIAPVALGHQILIAPIEIPDVLPAIDLSRRVTDPIDYDDRRGAAGGRHDGVAGVPVRPVTGEVTYFAAQVDRPVVQIAGTAVPDYPEQLSAAMIEGEVRVQFVVDTTGRAELESFKVLRSPHALFSDAVRKALVRMRFKPAEAGSLKVRQIVEMPFAFSIKR
jgi:protein TonB